MASSTQQLDRSARLALGQIRRVGVVSFNGHRFGIPAFSDVTIWNGPVDSYTFTDPSSARIDKISSDDVGDTGQIQILGLDENWDQVVQIVTLNGQNKVSLTTELIRINNAISLKDLIGSVYIYEDGVITGGIPDDLETVKGFISPEDNWTRSITYSVPRNYILNLKKTILFSLPVTSGCCFRFKTYTKLFGGVTLLSLNAPITGNGSTAIELSPSTAAPFPEKSDIFAKVETSLPNSAVALVFDSELIRV